MGTGVGRESASVPLAITRMRQSVPEKRLEIKKKYLFKLYTILLVL